MPSRAPSNAADGSKPSTATGTKSGAASAGAAALSTAWSPAAAASSSSEDHRSSATTTATGADGTRGPAAGEPEGSSAANCTARRFRLLFREPSPLEKEPSSPAMLRFEEEGDAKCLNDDSEPEVGEASAAVANAAVALRAAASFRRSSRSARRSSSSSVPSSRV